MAPVDDDGLFHGGKSCKRPNGLYPGCEVMILVCGVPGLRVVDQILHHSIVRTLILSMSMLPHMYPHTGDTCLGLLPLADVARSASVPYGLCVALPIW